MKKLASLYFIIIFFSSCVKLNLKDYEKVNNYIIISKYIYELNCNRPAESKVNLIKNTKIQPIYKGNVFDNNELNINRYYCTTVYNKKSKTYEIFIPIHKFNNSKTSNLKFSNNKKYLDKTITLKEFTSMSNDTIFMELLPKYSCTDLELKNPGTVIKK